MARVNIKVGDIFSVSLDSNNEKYFQFIANDSIQLNSNVIRVFKGEYSNNTRPTGQEIIKGEVEFYAHCIINLGVKMGLWKKVDNNNDVGRFEICFKGTNDYGSKAGEEPVKVSNRWYVWKINDKEFTKIGTLVDPYKKAEIGIVINPLSILNRIRTGKYDFEYPGE